MGRTRSTKQLHAQLRAAQTPGPPVASSPGPGSERAAQVITKCDRLSSVLSAEAFLTPAEGLESKRARFPPAKEPGGATPIPGDPV